MYDLLINNTIRNLRDLRPGCWVLPISTDKPPELPSVLLLDVPDAAEVN